MASRTGYTARQCCPETNDTFRDRNGDGGSRTHLLEVIIGSGTIDQFGRFVEQNWFHPSEERERINVLDVVYNSRKKIQQNVYF